MPSAGRKELLMVWAHAPRHPASCSGDQSFWYFAVNCGVHCHVQWVAARLYCTRSHTRGRPWVWEPMGLIPYPLIGIWKPKPGSQVLGQGQQILCRSGRHPGFGVEGPGHVLYHPCEVFVVSCHKSGNQILESGGRSRELRQPSRISLVRIPRHCSR
jgi:hypothetical protein